MIRQYRAFEDLEEPCFLVPEPEWITITYQMKSIICQWRWDEIKELVPKKLSPTKKSKKDIRDTESVKELSHSQTQIKPHHSNSAPASPNLRIDQSHHLNQSHLQRDPEKILKKNLLKIEFLKKPVDQQQQKPKWYRFDSRDILDEFLSDANRHGYIERLVISRWFSTKVKYLPKCLIEQHSEESKKKNKNKKKQKQKQKHRNSSTSSSSSSSSSLSSESISESSSKKKYKQVKTKSVLVATTNNNNKKNKNANNKTNNNNNIVLQHQEGTRV